MTDTGRTVFGPGAAGAQTSIVDPATYQSAWGEGFVLENLGTAGLNVANGKVNWDRANPLNQSPISPVEEFDQDAAFAWDVDAGRVNQSGLHVVEWRIEWNTMTSSGADHYTVKVEVPATGIRTERRFANSVTAPTDYFVAWLPEGSVRLKIVDGVTLESSTISEAYLRLAPMFTLSGIEES